jgi:nitroreductase
MQCSVQEAISARHSVRGFAGKAVTSEQVTQLLEAAVAAPSAGNRQPWHFFVVRDSEVRQNLVRAAGGQTFVGEAQVVIVVCADQQRSAARYGQRGIRLYCIQDTAAAVENILLTAVAIGLGACWVGAFDDDAVAMAIDCPGELHPVAIIPVGDPAGDTKATSRRPLDEVVTYIG